MPNNDPNSKREAPARKSTPRARGLRQTQTTYEAKLWKLLRNRQLDGTKFRRQVPIGLYFADFACIQEKLVIELDGNGHDGREEHDRERDAFLHNDGWRTTRIANRDLMKDEASVWLSIERILQEKTQ